MNKVNARLTTCEHCCKEQACAVTHHENGDEISVCTKCGKVFAKHRFEALDFVVGLMRDGIVRESEIVECLTDKISDEYYWLDDIDKRLRDQESAKLIH